VGNKNVNAAQLAARCRECHSRPLSSDACS
jgi:hypothetical protein